VLPDAAGVVVHDRYAVYDYPKVGVGTHQLCCAHYPDTVVMPIRGWEALAGGGDRPGDIGITERLAA
jgi:hypothetical protein